MDRPEDGHSVAPFLATDSTNQWSYQAQKTSTENREEWRTEFGGQVNISRNQRLPWGGPSESSLCTERLD